jgi:hypothetical protein
MRAAVLAAERVVLAAAAASTPAQDLARVAPSQAEFRTEVVEAGRGYPLSAEQRAVLHDVVTSGRAVEAIVGPPRRRVGCGGAGLSRSPSQWSAPDRRVAHGGEPGPGRRVADRRVVVARRNRPGYDAAGGVGTR